MGHGTVRISETAHGILRALARADDKSMLAVLDEAVEPLRRQRFLGQVNAAYAALRADTQAWEAVEAERREWEATLSDGVGVAEPRPSYETRKRSAKGPRRP